MGGMLQRMANRFGQSVLDYRQHRLDELRQHRYINDIIEHMIDDIDPRLRAISGYQKVLTPCVERVLTYGENVCANLPGPVEFSSENSRNNATVRALFANKKKMAEVFSRCRELQEFFRQHPSADRAYMVLGMKKTEARVFGMEQQGEIVRKDVPQINVSFDDYRISHPSHDETSLRKHLRERALHECVAQTINRLMEEKNLTDEMHEHELKLKMQLGMLLNQHHGLSSMMTGDAPISDKIRQVRRHLNKVEHKLGEMKQDTGTLNVFLDKVAYMLDRPDELLHVSSISLCLDRMNRLIEGEASRETDRIKLGQVVFGGKDKRVGVLASFPRNELVAESRLPVNIL